MFRSNANVRTYILKNYVSKGNPQVISYFTRGEDYTESVASRILKYYTNNEDKLFVISYFNNSKAEEKEFTNESNGTYISIGSFRSNKAEQLAEMDTYAVRIYDRALTDEEIQANYEIDKYRFGITE